MKIRVRTKFLLASLAVAIALTAMCLVLVRRAVILQARRVIQADLRSSVIALKKVHKNRQSVRLRSVRLMADLPIVRALMTTEDPGTIQDASEGLFNLADTDLLVLADRDGRVMAAHSRTHDFGRVSLEEQLERSLKSQGTESWWLGNGRLYAVSWRPIYFGGEKQHTLFGYLVLGDEADTDLLGELSDVANSQVAIFSGDTLVKTTLPGLQAQGLTKTPGGLPHPEQDAEMQIDGEHFIVATVDLTAPDGAPARFVVLKSLDRATAFVRDLNRTLLLTGIAANLAGVVLVFLISGSVTRPLRDLVAGVRALGKGDFQYPLAEGGSDEVAEVTTSFSRMRDQIQTTQHELIQSEKLATIGRMASSISHDLRHQLVAIQANAEYLVDGRRTEEQREELYQEVRSGVREMNDLLESLLEFSRKPDSLRRSRCRLDEVVTRAIQNVRLNPAYQNIEIASEISGSPEGMLDCKRIERALYNLLLNACAAAASASHGAVKIRLNSSDAVAYLEVLDNGPGIPAEIRERIFEAFVSFGKENGTGLGLTLAQRIVREHGGELYLVETSQIGTRFRIRLPLEGSAAAA